MTLNKTTNYITKLLLPLIAIFFLAGCYLQKDPSQDKSIDKQDEQIIEKNDTNDNNPEIGESKESEIKVVLISDEEIADELKYIQAVIQLNKGKKEIEKAFDERYYKYVIPNESLPGIQPNLNDLHIYIYSSKNKLLAFKVGDTIIKHGIETGRVAEVRDHSFVFESNNYREEYTEDYFYNDFDLYFENLLLTRKSGIRMEIYYTREDRVAQVDIYYVNKDNQVNTILYGLDGSINYNYNTKAEKQYKQS